MKYVKTNDLKNKKRTNRVKQYVLFKFKNLSFGFLFDRIKSEASKVIHRTKITAKLLHEAYIETGQKVFRDISNEICQNANILFWKWDKEYRWEHEIIQKRKNPLYKQFISGLNNKVWIEKSILHE